MTVTEGGICRGNPADGAAHMLDRHQGQWRRRRLDRRHDRVDGGVAQLLEETALPVVELPRPVPHGLQQGLDRLVRHRGDGVGRG